ncbi:hypothetical protein HN51_053233 [Arachis hypogaea]|uniref:Transmembrane protein, putative n=1 Tax=Arachis hypogaea TaxID=3818 RepID=A0A444XBQ7_ARAHY|nr:uncharacterized protein LOC112709725 [Arachis hypogaea]XP_025679236.1 uncharacterized protein LOC112779206 [Arachis hypogaea]XP_057735553.1 uncharacterized protein LOC130950964 [Arachis stenosperma]QHN75553.1 Transmembrane protein, putative [Arachis hypogaea]QHO32936.1 Transmembrane protein, putative [Arachis hypogaea]RYQ87141.1 hypothetical protein Ahy_B09g094614 [Arachis hypogaea]RYR40975.1 hypothetical protein Ahy_A09g046717 [Arachis hypogaea]
MKSETKAKVGSGGFRAKLDHYLYSGSPKHVFVGIVLITAVFSVPWFLRNRGTTHQSHQDYLERADKARSQRLSASSAATK